VTAAPVAHDAALVLLSSLVLENGRRWGEQAQEFQWRDAAEILNERSPTPYSFLTRPRGGSKTTDLAAIALTVMIAQAPPGARLYALAADRGQGTLLLDAVDGFVKRTPFLNGVVEISAYRALVTETDVSLEVMAADAPGAWGLRPYFLVVDELAQWAETPRSARLFEAVRTATGKVNGKMVILTTAGDPAHFAARVRDHARDDPLWRLHEVPGPVPWLSPERLDEQRRALTDSVFRRLHLNEWVEPPDRLALLEDVRACVTHGARVPPRHGISYVIGLDIGIVKDRTAAAVCHAEADGDSGYRVVVDDLRTWQGSREAPVQLDDVQAFLEATARTYRDALIVYDPHQAIGLAQVLRKRGVRAEAYDFTTASVSRLAGTLLQLIRGRALALPDDPDLILELSRVRVRETSPTQIRLDHDPGEHDDRAIAIALAAERLIRTPPNAGLRIRHLR
jgi:hypothetical protein